MMVAPERWDTPLMFEDVFEPILHHGWTHNQKNEHVLSDLEKLDKFTCGSSRRPPRKWMLSKRRKARCSTA